MTIPVSAQQPLLEGQLEEAASILRAHLKEQPDDRESTLELARVLLGLEQFDGSESLFTPLLESNPKDAQALGVRGLWHQLNGNEEAARADYEKALSIQPEQSDVQYNLGRIIVHQDELSEEDAKSAESYLKRALELEPNHFQAQFELAALYTRQFDTIKALEACEKTIHLNPYHLRAYLFMGEVFSAAGEIDGVIKLYKAGLLNNPLAHIFRDELIRLYRQKGSNRKAFDIALEQSKMRGAYEDFLELGNISIETKQFDIAEVAFRKAEQLRENSWEASFNLGEIYRGAGALEEAEKAYKRSLEKTASAQAFTGLGVIAFEAEPQRLDEAISYFRKAFDFNPQDPTYLHNFALALYKANEIDELKLVVDLAQQLLPEDTKALRDTKKLLK
ncbi:MAG: hypothetical protein CL920_30930 [Deltaproteobacteria bacterium]|nr:hypothetical protein [Deltaproteobacteria bacterium]MBU53131.1 hypothetical protein [Deltaproteobacteria bacterium]|tara:strand:+ start:7784 stop:8956 length:1173 start_codon:yes stop_codon:yes gene_type:complete